MPFLQRPGAYCVGQYILSAIYLLIAFLYLSLVNGYSYSANSNLNSNHYGCLAQFGMEFGCPP